MALSYPAGDAVAHIVDLGVAHLLHQVAGQGVGAAAGAADDDDRVVLAHFGCEARQEVGQSVQPIGLVALNVAAKAALALPQQ